VKPVRTGRPAGVHRRDRPLADLDHQVVDGALGALLRTLKEKIETWNTI